MKKFVQSLMVLFLIATLAACGSEESSGSGDKKETKQENEESSKVLTEEEFTKMYSDVKKYKGDKVEFYAKVFLEPEKDDDGTYMQVYANNNDERNTLVSIDDPDLDVKMDDIIKVQGYVYDEYEGENMMGAKLILPMIKADSVEISDYMSAFAPALKTVDVNEEIDQHGLKVTLTKIEIAENETRLYVTVNNTTDSSASFYDFDTKLLLGSQQLEVTDNYESNYPEVQSDLLPGVKSEGILTFPAIPKSGSVKVYTEGSTDNWDLEFTPYEFEIEY